MSFALSALIYFLAISAVGLALWMVAAFVLRFGHRGRMLTTLGVPTLAAAAWIWWGYHSAPARGMQPGATAEIAFVVSSLLIGGVLGLLVLPVWFLIEAKLGVRAPKE